MERRDLNIICDNAVNWRMYQDKTVFVTGALMWISNVCLT